MKRLFPIIPFDHLSLTSLFSDMAVDPKGLGFSAMKCEFSCIDCLEHQWRCQLGNLMSVKSKPALLQHWLLRLSEIMCNCVVLFPPCSFLKGGQTQTYLSQSLLCNVFMQRKRGDQGGVTDRGEINYFCREE